MEGQKPVYEVLKAEEYKYGNNKFLEVSRKTVDGTETLFISRGFYNPAGEKRYKGGIGFPDDEEIKTFLVENINSI